MISIQDRQAFTDLSIIIKMMPKYMQKKINNGEVVFQADYIERIDEIENYDADIYLIDEFQFLQGEITPIQKLASKGKKFYIAGLNLTTEMKPFGKMGDLLCNSDNVKMMTAHCECCNKNEAIYTYCTIEKTGDILVGEDMYIPVCAECYTKLMSKRNK